MDLTIPPAALEIEMLKAECWNMKMERDRAPEWRDHDKEQVIALRAEVERLRALLDLYREAVRIDATMEGPKFLGSNASALKRAWDADRAALNDQPAPGKEEA